MNTVNDRVTSAGQLPAELQTVRALLTWPGVPAPDGQHPAAPNSSEMAMMLGALRASEDRQGASERRRQAAEELRDILAIVDSTRTLDDILDQFIAQACRLLDADAGAIYGLQELEELLRLRAAHGLAAEVSVVRIPVGWGPIGRAVKQRRLIAAALDPVANPEASAAAVEPQQLASWAELVRRYTTVLAVPLVIRDRVYGAIVLYQQSARTFSDEEIQLALAFGDHAALAIENARLFAIAHDSAALAERQRLARELHDSVLQALYAVKLYAEAAMRRLAASDGAAATDYLREIRSVAQEALQEMRLLIFELRPPILEQEGLAVAVRARLEAVEGRAGLRTQLTVEGEHRPPAALEQALYRIAQEALNNVLKHAHARRISVVLVQEPQRTVLSVADDGTGFERGQPMVQGGLGLRGMEERVAQLHGRLAVESTPGMGTVIRVEIEHDTSDSSHCC